MTTMRDLHDQPVYCDITEEDEKRLGKRFVQLHVVQATTFDTLVSAVGGRRAYYGAIKTAWVENKSGPFKGVSACRCVALKGSLMHKVRCSVYNKRLATCHKAVKPGDRACREVRRMAQALLEDAKGETE